MTFHLAFCISLFDGLAFVVQLLTLAKPDFHLGNILFIEVNAQWHDGVAFLFDLGFELAQFFFVEQEFTFLRGYVVVEGAVTVFGDVKAFDPELTFMEEAIGIIEGGSALAE